MSRPNNSIGKIKLPGENVERPIIPYALGYSSSNNYQATLPILTADDFIVTTGSNQTITGEKTFNSDGFHVYSGSIQLYNSDDDGLGISSDGTYARGAWEFQGSIWAEKGVTIASSNGPYTYGDPYLLIDCMDTDALIMKVKPDPNDYQKIYNFYAQQPSSGVSTINLTYPARSGVIGLQVDIVDLTQL